MPSLASQIANLVPEGNFKNNLRHSAFRALFATVGTRRVQIGTSKDKVSATIGRLIFTKESLGERENEGYLKHYQLKPGDTVVNAGAYHGYFAIYAAKKVGSTGRVICFEPEPNNVRLLQKNIALNNLTNVKIISQGLWSKNTTLPLISMGSGSNLQPTSGWDKQQVVVTTLDSALLSLNVKNINLLTMDVEGAEIEALKGATSTLKNSPDIHLAIASYHKLNSQPTFSHLEKILRQNGLHSFTSYPRHLTTYGYYQHS
jgi:FkbM family methyltransferase